MIDDLIAPPDALIAPSRLPALFPAGRSPQERSRLGLQMHQIILVTFSRVLAARLGKFPPPLSPRWDGFGLGEGWKWSRALLTDRRGVKFLMGKQVRAAGCPEEGGQKR